MPRFKKNPDDTTLYYPEETNWEDLRFPFTAANADTVNGRIDFNYAECTLDFESNARYPEEPVCIISQMSHDKKLGSRVHPHLHWVQENSAIPNFLLAYRWYNNGEVSNPAFKFLLLNQHVFSYASGEIAQISAFPFIEAPVDEKASSMLDMKVYRDTANTSTLFAGVDTYTGDARVKELDLHFIKDSVGSGTEFTKV